MGDIQVHGAIAEPARPEVEDEEKKGRATWDPELKTLNVLFRIFGEMQVPERYRALSMLESRFGEEFTV